MPRANRHYVPGQVWHITHRCHEQAFLLKFVRDRDRYVRWLFEARKRFGLCVLNYAVTSNHVHLLVKDTTPGAISRSIQLVAGKTGQEYNKRKGRKGGYWEDRYHATAVEAGEHLRRCLVYIDLNMVRAGAVRHPFDWAHGGYREIQTPPRRYRIIDLLVLSVLCGFESVESFQTAHRQWVEDALDAGSSRRDERWSTALAVGGSDYLRRLQSALGSRASNRQIVGANGDFSLQEAASPYSAHLNHRNPPLRATNTYFWRDSRYETSL